MLVDVLTRSTRDDSLDSEATWKNSAKKKKQLIYCWFFSSGVLNSFISVRQVFQSKLQMLSFLNDKNSWASASRLWSSPVVLHSFWTNAFWPHRDPLVDRCLSDTPGVAVEIIYNNIIICAKTSEYLLFQIQRNAGCRRTEDEKSWWVTDHLPPAAPRCLLAFFKR